MLNHKLKSDSVKKSDHQQWNEAEEKFKKKNGKRSDNEAEVEDEKP